MPFPIYRVSLQWTFQLWQKSLDLAVKLNIFTYWTIRFEVLSKQNHKIDKTSLNSQLRDNVSLQNARDLKIPQMILLIPGLFKKDYQHFWNI